MQPEPRAGLGELFRYEKDGRIRVYSLRSLERTTELWVASRSSGRWREPARRVIFKDGDDVALFLEDVEQTLRLSGWRLTSP
jgi:hypothetical protein